MPFLNPILLAGLAGIGIPIAIHLLNRRRFRKVPWAAMRYLKASVERNQRRMELQDWILLAIRCLLVALLAITLARPALRALSSGWLDAESASVVVLDRSASMTALAGSNSRFDQAREAALGALESVPRGSAALLPVPVGEDALPLLTPAASSDDWKPLLEELAPTAASAHLAPAVARATEYLQSQAAARRELVVISDRQQVGWRDLDAIVNSLAKAGSDVQVHVVLVGDAEPASRQLGVSDVSAGQTLTLASRPARLDLTVTNYGTEDARQVPVRVLLDGSPEGDVLEIAAIRAGESATVQTYLEFKEAGYHHVRVELPDDTLPADNARTTIVRAFQKIRLLLVDGDPGVRASDCETFFLRHGLAPVTSGAGDSPVQVEVVSPQDLTGRTLKDYAAVFLANVADLAPDSVQELSRYVRQGGGLVVFPGDRVNVDFYNRDLAQKAGLLPAKLGDRWKENLDTGKRLQGSGFTHPLVKEWNDSDFGSLAAASFLEGFGLTMAESSAGSTAVVLRFDDAAPALAERRLDRGWVYLFASTADTAWNELPIRPAFVPLLSHLIGRIFRGADDALHLEAGEAFDYPLPLAFAGKASVIYPLDAGGAKGVQRPIGASLHYAHTLTAGAYEASVAEPPLRLLFAVQPALEESDADTLTSAQLDTLRGSANVVSWTPGMKLGEILSSQRAGAELWKLFLVGVLALAVTEIFLAQGFSHAK